MTMTTKLDNLLRISIKLGLWWACLWIDLLSSTKLPCSYYCRRMPIKSFHWMGLTGSEASQMTTELFREPERTRQKSKEQRDRIQRRAKRLLEEVLGTPEPAEEQEEFCVLSDRDDGDNSASPLALENRNQSVAQTAVVVEGQAGNESEPATSLPTKIAAGTEPATEQVETEQQVAEEPPQAAAVKEPSLPPLVEVRGGQANEENRALASNNEEIHEVVAPHSDDVAQSTEVPQRDVETN